jgi:hypothetical protein
VLAKLGQWLVSAVLGWLVTFVTDMITEYRERKRIAKEREEANKAAEQKLENAQTEQEVIDAGSDLLNRN